MRRVEISNAASVVLEQDPVSMMETIAGVVTAIAAVGMLWVAYKALETWRAQLKGQTRFELAKKLMTAVNDMAQKFHTARSQVTYANEYPQDYNDRNPNDIDDDMRADATRHVLLNRYKSIHEAGATIVGMLPEVRTMFPEEIAIATEAFLDAPWQLKTDMQILVEQMRHGHFEANLAHGDRDALARLRAERRQQYEAVYAPPPRPGQEVVNPQTNNLIAGHEALSALLRPYLELSLK